MNAVKHQLLLSTAIFYYDVDYEAESVTRVIVLHMHEAFPFRNTPIQIRYVTRPLT